MFFTIIQYKFFRNNMQKWYQEPLFHFLLLGAIVFYISYKNEPRVTTPLQKHLSISKSNIDQLLSQWKQEKQSLPTKTELDELIEYYIENQILYEEALRMELDKNEPEIKKILIDKLKYMANTSIEINEIPKEKLQNYFQEHKEKFIKKSDKKISFQHIFFNPKHHTNIESKANSIFKEIQILSEEGNLSHLGDKFYAGHQFQNINKKELAKIFSQSFIRELFKLPTQRWSKPIKSGFGIHIIYVRNQTSSKETTFHNVEKEVINEYLIEQNYNAYKKLYERLRNEYTVTIETDTYINKN